MDFRLGAAIDRRRRACQVFAVGAAIGPALLLTSAGPAAAIGRWVKPAGSCSQADSIQVQATVHGEFENLTPTALGTTGSIVSLRGIARRFKVVRESDCRIRTRSLGRKQWSMSRQDFGGLPQDASHLLSRPRGANAYFIASDPGIYDVEFAAAAGAYRSPVRVDILPPGPGTARWISLGPNGSVDAQGRGIESTGKIQALAFDPTSSGARLYAGSHNGGVWKSEDRGDTWIPLTDNKDPLKPAIGAVAVAADGSVFVGGLEWAQCRNAAPCRPAEGIWKSSDQGKTWQRVGMNTAACPAGSVPATSIETRRFVTHPQNAAALYAATGTHLLRSMDGGNCWQPITTDMNASKGLDIAAAGPDRATLYVVAPEPVTLAGNVGPAQLFKTTNAWDANPTFEPLALPTLSKGYDTVSIAGAPSHSSTVYAAFASDKKIEIIRSIDAGATWRVGQPPCAQCNYNLSLAVSPVDPDRLIYGEVGVKEETWGAGQVTWYDLNEAGKHADVHAVEFAPDDPNRVYIGTDGGVYTGTLGAEAGFPMSAWTSRNYGLGTTIGLGIAIAPTNPSSTAIGQWDNSRYRWLGRRAWEGIGTYGEGRGITFDAGTDSILYATYHGVSDLTIRRHADGRRFPGPVVPGYASDYGFCSITGKKCTAHADCPFQDELQTCVLGAHARAVMANPFRSGEILAQFREGNQLPWELYATRGAAQSSSVTWRCVYPDPDGASSVVSVDFPDDSSYVVSKTQGRPVTYFRLSNLTGVQRLCSEGSPDVEDVEILYNPPSNASNVRVAVDPIDPSSVYIVDDYYSSLRFFYVSRSPGGVVTTDLGDFSLPWPERAQTIAPDPVDPTTVWLGTTAGLYRGSRQPGGSLAWTRNLDVPEVPVTEIAVHRERASDGTASYSGAMRLATAGRGVWERVFSQSCTNCIKEVYCADCVDAADRGQPLDSGREQWIGIRYQYDGAAGARALIRIVPTVDGVDTGHFISEIARVRPGEGTSLHFLRYAALNAPATLKTNGLRVELLNRRNGAVLGSSTLPYEKLWTQENHAILTIEAVTKRPDQTQLPVVVHYYDYDASFSAPAPLRHAAPTFSLIEVSAPATYGDEPVYYFEGWSTDGLPQGGPAQTTLFVSPAQSMVLTATYAKAAPGPPPPACGDAAAPACAGTCPPAQICVDGGGCVCVPENGPDLVVTLLSPLQTVLGCQLLVNVRNDGDAPAIASTLLVSGISGADTITNEAPIGGLAPGQDAQAQVTLDALTCTPLVVTATVDSKNVVSEYAEGNNILREGF